MPPRLFTPRTWLPATPMTADSTGTPTSVSASSTARRIELTARSRLTICPLRQPFDSAAPSAANFTLPSSSISPISAQVFVLPISSATTCRSFFANALLLTLQETSCESLSRVLGASRRMLRGDGRALRRRYGPLHDLRDRRRVRVHHRFAVEAQVHRLHAPGRRAPLADIVEQRLILRFEVAVAEMNQDGRVRIAPACQRTNQNRQLAASAPPVCRPVSVARKSCASDRSTSLTCSTAPARADPVCCMKPAKSCMRFSRSSAGIPKLIPVTTGKWKFPSSGRSRITP